MSEEDFERFLEDWREYEITLTQILPRSIYVEDPEIGEEISHLLSARSNLEEDLDRFTDDLRLLQFRARLVGLDAELLRRSEDIRCNLSPREYQAQGLQRGGSHWWWHLEETGNPCDTPDKEAMLV